MRWLTMSVSQSVYVTDSLSGHTTVIDVLSGLQHWIEHLEEQWMEHWIEHWIEHHLASFGIIWKPKFRKSEHLEEEHTVKHLERETFRALPLPVLHIFIAFLSPSLLVAMESVA